MLEDISQLTEQEIIERAGWEGIEILHKLAYQNCKVPFAHCHDKPCKCGGCDD